jgi:hypothetical protein
MLMLRLSIVLGGLVVLASATSGCVVRGRTHVGYSAHVSSEPALVEVSPGVMVIEDYHEPVFYSDGYYWRSYNGVWMRSSYHTGGWVTVHRPPHRIVSIRSPRAYVRYRARPGVVRHRGAVRGGNRNHVRRDGRVIHKHPADGRHRDDRGRRGKRDKRDR